MSECLQALQTDGSSDREMGQQTDRTIMIDRQNDRQIGQNKRKVERKIERQMKR